MIWKDRFATIMIIALARKEVSALTRTNARRILAASLGSVSTGVITIINLVIIVVNVVVFVIISVVIMDQTRCQQVSPHYCQSQSSILSSFLSLSPIN